MAETQAPAAAANLVATGHELIVGRLGGSTSQLLALQAAAQAFQNSVKLPGIANTQGKITPVGGMLDFVGDTIGKLTYQAAPGGEGGIPAGDIPRANGSGIGPGGPGG